MELGKLIDLCSNEMTELDYDTKPQENVLHDDFQIAINDSATANFAVVGPIMCNF